MEIFPENMILFYSRETTEDSSLPAVVADTKPPCLPSQNSVSFGSSRWLELVRPVSQVRKSVLMIISVAIVIGHVCLTLVVVSLPLYVCLLLFYCC